MSDSITTYNPVTQTGDISSQVLPMLSKMSKERLRHHVFMTELVNKDYSEEIAEAGDEVKVPTISGGTVQDHTDGTDFTTQELTHDVDSVRLNKNKILPISITNITNLFKKKGFMQEHVDHMLGLMAERIEDDIFALYSSFSTNNYTAQGSSGEIAYTDFSKIMRKLKDARIPNMGRPNFVISNFDESLLQNVANFSEYDKIGTGDRMANAVLGGYKGFNLFTSTKIPTVSVSAGTQYKNIAFHKDAIAFVTRSLYDGVDKRSLGVYEAEVRDPKSGLIFMYMLSYDHKGKRYIFDLHTLYGVNVYRETFASIVTSVEA